MLDYVLYQLVLYYCVVPRYFMDRTYIYIYTHTYTYLHTHVYIHIYEYLCILVII